MADETVRVPRILLEQVTRTIEHFHARNQLDWPGLVRRLRHALNSSAQQDRSMAAEYQAWLDFFHAGEGDFHDFQKRHAAEPDGVAPTSEPPAVDPVQAFEREHLGEPYSAPLNGIAATDFHGEGAIARCSYCGRYSLDRKTLGEDRYQPVCECGEKHGWSGSFKKPGPDAKWSGAAPGVEGRKP